MLIEERDETLLDRLTQEHLVARVLGEAPLAHHDFDEWPQSSG